MDLDDLFAASPMEDEDGVETFPSSVLCNGFGNFKYS